MRAVDPQCSRMPHMGLLYRQSIVTSVVGNRSVEDALGPYGCSLKLITMTHDGKLLLEGLHQLPREQPEPQKTDPELSAVNAEVNLIKNTKIQNNIFR